MMDQRIKLYFKSKANTFDVAAKRTYTSLSSIAGIILRATSFKICALKNGIPPPLCDPFNTVRLSKVFCGRSDTVPAVEINLKIRRTNNEQAKQQPN